MRVIKPEEIDRIELPELFDDDKHIGVYLKNGEYERWRATLSSSMFGIVPCLEATERQTVHFVPDAGREEPQS